MCNRGISKNMYICLMCETPRCEAIAPFHSIHKSNATYDKNIMEGEERNWCSTHSTMPIMAQWPDLVKFGGQAAKYLELLTKQKKKPLLYTFYIQNLRLLPRLDNRHWSLSRISVASERSQWAWNTKTSGNVLFARIWRVWRGLSQGLDHLRWEVSSSISGGLWRVSGILLDS